MKKILKLGLIKTDYKEELDIRWCEDMPFREQLGYLEWAKAIIIEALKTDNLLSMYTGEVDE